ncbi:DUF1996 domain-containing protein [Streptomyces sp. MS1.AVA.4]|uniref:DUF1996 domain-containing protein n=1 Tax=Streptomyces pratisoli TaxID=3139917 RepID=A0ACC6QSK3_9ACTN
MVGASIALMLAGGGLIAVNSYASAGEGWGWAGEQNEQQNQTRNAGSSASTIKCPEVANGLSEVPEGARPEVDRELATMDSQITEAYERFVDQREQIERDPQFAQNAVLAPLQSKREASIERIVIAIGRVAGEGPQGLESMAPCALQVDDAEDAGGADSGENGGQGQDQGAGQDGNGQDGGNGDGDQGDGGQGDGGQGGAGQAGNGPEASDFVSIESVQPNAQSPRKLRNASRGTFATDCGVNANGKFNPDNVIVAPGVSNGAHHMHDYVGNQANDAFASDDDLANGATTCRDQGDKSTYYWPVLRVQNGQNEGDVDADGGGKDKNVGEIQTPAQVTLNFVGSPVSKVTAMPRFLRIITGDAKAFVNGNANANASWSCTGFEDRQLKDKYPVCPQGSKVVRSFKFQSCWDGQNTDSANHRTHVAFADEGGRCPDGFKAIPQLVQRIVYDVPPPVLEGANPVVFAVDSFPEQLHKPVTDHGDFINVFDDELMRTMVDCINGGRECGPGGAGEPSAPPADDPAPPADEPDAPPADEPDAPPADEPDAPPADDPAPPADEPDAPPADEPAAPPADDQQEPGGQEPEGQEPGAQEPEGQQPEAQKPDAQKPEAQKPANQKPVTQDSEVLSGSAAGTSGGQSTPDARQTTPVPDSGTEPQASRGGLAATGAQLWPSAAGAALLIAGIVLLRTRNRSERAARHR